ncbi:MAG: T9SS type A sorting domain-containing protein [Balneolaceae bacterium]|nr:T9SS type A sorting domain-containing protein [Balneolaceae bacterium]
MKLLFCVISVLFVSSVQAQVVSEVSTSKSMYEYGEPIEITFTLSNQSDTFHSYQGTGTYSVHFVDFSGISLIPTYTTLDDFRDTLWSGESLEITWELNPEKLGLPPISGTQNITISVLGICDSVSFEAPKYRGGPMSVYFNEEVVDTMMADSILARYNAEILRDDFPSYNLELNGFQIDSLSEVWLEENYILEAHFDQRNDIDAIGWIRTDLEEEDSKLAFKLGQNYPNPFNPSTNIPLTIDTPGQTNISVYKVTGEKVFEIYDGWLGAGAHSFRFEASGLASGTYIYKVVYGNREAVQTMTLIK